MIPEIKEVHGAIGATLEVPINWTMPQCFVALKYWDADPTLGAANAVVPSAGTAVVTARLEVHDQYVSLANGTFDCTDVAAYTTFIGNVNRVKAVPTNITGPTHWTLSVVQNEEL